jgi:hypothetical protein
VGIGEDTMISTTNEEKTYRHIPRVLVNYFKLLCTTIGVPTWTYEVEEDSDPHTPGDLGGFHMVTVKDRSSYDILQRVFEEAYA